MPANYRPRTETERALHESLRNIELQCKERVELLETLKKSREESGPAAQIDTSSQTVTDTSARPINNTSAASGQGSESGNCVGSGTIPPIDYSDLSRPPPLPKRPATASRTSSATSSRWTPNMVQEEGKVHRLSPGLPNSRASKRDSRTPSPDKRSRMLRTLRINGKEGKSSKASERIGIGTRPPAAAKAATQAWDSLNTAAAATGSKVPPSEEFTPGSRELNNRAQERTAAMQTGLHRIHHAQSAASSVLATNQMRPGSPTRDEQIALRDHHVHVSNTQEYVRPTYQHIPAGNEDASSSRNSLPLSRAGPHTKDIGIDPKQHVLPLKEAPMLSYRSEYPLHDMKRDPNTENSLQRSTMNAKKPHIARQPLSSRKKVPPSDMKARRSTEGKTSSGVEGEYGDQGNGSDLLHENISSGDNGSSREGTATPNADDNFNMEKIFQSLPKGVDADAAKQILNEIVVQGDEVHWEDIAGLEIAKAALKETVVYPFLRPDLFMGLREPARGMLLFGPPGTGKTMLARAVATESRSTFFAISASSLTSKFLGESEKLVRALFAIAKSMAPSIIFVDEIDSLLSSRSGSSEHEATRRIKTEFLIQWSDLARAAAGREPARSGKGKGNGDASRVLVLAATNLPWAIDEAARRRFVRRQYIPLPEAAIRKQQLRTLLSHQIHNLTEEQLDELVELTNCTSTNFFPY